MISPLSKAFVHAIEVFAKELQIDLITFDKNQRKDEVTQEYLARTSFTEGVLYIGKAQEKAAVFRTIHKRNAETGKVLSLDQPRQCLTEPFLLLPVGL